MGAICWRQLKISELWCLGHTGSADLTGSESTFSFTANAGMVSDEELEQMLDSVGRARCFVSNVSGRHQAPCWAPILSESLKKKKILFIHFQLCWVFVAVQAFL